MKMLLLVAMIHLLILHQYWKDKKETLAPKVMIPSKSPIQDDFSLHGFLFNARDSIHFSYHIDKARARYDFANFTSW